jgi:glyoxylase I family protein
VPRHFHHIAIEVSDAARSERFYCDLLGFKKTGEYHFPDRGRTIVFVELEGVCVELLQDEGVEPYVEPPAKQAGYKHLCLQTDDALGAYERLKAAGVTIRLEPFDTALDSRIFFFEDPDGLPLELWQPLA